MFIFIYLIDSGIFIWFSLKTILERRLERSFYLGLLLCNTFYNSIADVYVNSTLVDCCGSICTFISCSLLLKVVQAV